MPRSSKKPKADEPLRLIVCLDGDRVACFLSRGDAWRNPCGTPDKDWRYDSPKSIMLWVEGRNTRAGQILTRAHNLAIMLHIKLENYLVQKECVARAAKKG
jgi:hypothetical protein